MSDYFDWWSDEFTSGLNSPGVSRSISKERNSTSVARF